jgi:two-component system cell cycle sensor histidine kinase/response regulator CckA
MTGQGRLELGALLEAAPDATLAVDREGRVIAANRAADELFGYAAGELAGVAVDLLVPERLRGGHAGHRAAYAGAPRRRAMGAGLPLEGRRRDGSEFPVEISLAPYEDPAAGGWITIAAARDVSERQRVRELALQIRRQEIVAGLGRRALLTADIGAVLDDAVRTIAETLDVPKTSVLEPVQDGSMLTLRAGVGWAGDWAGEPAALERTPAGRAYTRRSSVVVADLPSDPDYARAGFLHSQGVWSIVCVPMLAPGRVLGVVGASSQEPREFSREDVLFMEAVANLLAAALVRHQTEAEKEIARGQLKAVLDNVPMPFWLKDVEGRFVVCNNEYDRLLGVAAGATLGRTVAELFPPEQAQALKAADDDVLVSGKPQEQEDRVDVGGELRTFISIKFPWFSSDGAVIGVGGVATDITERVQAEEEREQLHGRIARSERLESIGQLAGGIAHDFNNLLAVMTNFADFVSEELPPGDPLAEDVEQIQRAAQRAVELTRRLLIFSRRQVADPEPLEVGTVVRDVQNLLSRTIEEHVQVELDLPQDLPPVLMDRGELEQVILNLALNARDAMPNGGRLRLQTSTLELAEDWAAARGIEGLSGSVVKLSVADDGAGMPADVVARAFEPFFTTKAPGRGTGLGLATVYGIVTAAGGHVDLYSEPGAGTEVKVYVPAADPASVAAAKAAITADEPPLPAGLVALVVEDEPAVRELTRRILADAGYTVLIASGVKSAIETATATTTPIDLLVTDVVMPDGSGREVAERLRELFPAIGVIFCSGYTDDVLLRHGRAIVNAAFVEKPFAARRLLEAATHVLRANRAESGLR